MATFNHGLFILRFVHQRLLRITMPDMLLDRPRRELKVSTEEANMIQAD